MPWPPAARRPAASPRWCCPACRWAVTIRCIPSSSTPRVGCSSTWAAQPTPASRATASPASSAPALAWKPKPAPASGSMTRAGSVRSSRPPNATPPGFATAWAWRSTAPGGCSPPSTGATSCCRTGRRSIPTRRAPPSCRPRCCCRSARAAITAGPPATMTALRRRWCWPRNTAETAARPAASAPARLRRSPRSRPTGRPTT